MAKVFVFTPDGKILLATMKEGTTVICRDNFAETILCPKKELKAVPPDVLRFCKDTKQRYLYPGEVDGDWVTVK